MAGRSTVNVSLTPELNAFLERKVASGRYQTTSEVVREALRLLERQDEDRDAARRGLKAKRRVAARLPWASAEEEAQFAPVIRERKSEQAVSAAKWLKKTPRAAK